MSYNDAFKELVEVMDTLREKCPWDQKQTIHTLSNLTVEEVYELVEGISTQDWTNIKEELGDLMLHLLFYSKIATEEKQFTLEEMILAQIEKLKRRHPHIYGDLRLDDEAAVKQNWEKIKLAEGKKSVLGGVPNSLTAVIKAYRMQDKAAQVGFEWKYSEDVWDKVMEELRELHDVIEDENESIERKTEEMGDVLFSLINYARFNKIDPEQALQRVNHKFKSRFQYIENNALKPLSSMTLEEMDKLWDEAKEKGL
ncbi:MAG TPA: nucleoside triphosphate pyrophosphohydrolase [Saprospiraceae bacterium]|nr:nucleoside triphosphate pyrophosphohydrolase [Saprospiraceae bacterium]HQW95823.1 nucleoside triphosphate pyrophosphohydrolase [Saprospiraceae bacterium]